MQKDQLPPIDVKAQKAESLDLDLPEFVSPLKFLKEVSRDELHHLYSLENTYDFSLFIPASRQFYKV